jgi:[lysine-biosynthesis-protein LysW]--L-2-aminoadipate ligase
MRLGLIHSTIRPDEKLLLTAAKDLGASLETIDIRNQVLNPQTFKNGWSVLLQRCISQTLGLQATFFFESLGIPVVNSSQIAQVCENKLATSLRLAEHRVATIPFAAVFTESEAIAAVEELGGFPVVVKPITGSWGRLIAKVNDLDSLEAILEQKAILGGPMHKVFYLQKYIQKPGRDIRVTMVDHQPVCAIYRETKHWITNTARGAEAKNCHLDKDLVKICIATSKAIGGGILGIDIFETDKGYVVNEVNHATEFKNVQRVTNVNVAESMINYCLKVAKND